MNIPARVQAAAERLRALPDRVALAALGLATGVLAGGLTVLFVGAIDALHGVLLPGGVPDDFESLPALARAGLPLAGVVVAAALFAVLGPSLRIGVVHVIERMAVAGGRLPLRNAVLQFLGTICVLGTGASVGREGPAVHLGAVAGSVLGQHCRLTEQGLRTLVGCGVAAAIASNFNTPLAGVVFAMEVVLMEYTLAGFVPIILAAVAGATVGQLAFGAAPSLPVPPVVLGSLWELPLIVTAGLAIGALAAAFSRALLHVAACARPWPWPARLTAGGLATAAAGLAVPEVMGLGYDTVGRALADGYGVAMLVAIVALKLLATAAAIGCGLPGGLIGPTLVMGAAAGGVVGAAGAALAPLAVSHAGLYAILGAGAMMGATLQAPLAALTALLEMTGNPHIILPGMLAIVTACLASREIHGCDSVFHAQMRAAGLRYHPPGVAH